jgi:hypothetical protein
MTDPSAPVCRSQNADVNSVATHGLLVSLPKVYDNFYLQELLNTLKSQLASLNAVDQSTLLSHVGSVQGADLRQTGSAISAAGLPTPEVSTFVPAAGVSPYAPLPPGSVMPGYPTTTTPGATTMLRSATPLSPAPPQPSLTMPGGQTLGSLDTLNEEMQLSSEITNLQLLLDGALSDKLQNNTGQIKAAMTLGFPITIEPPTPDDTHHKNRVAEVEVTICTPMGVADDPPSILTLLPQSRTYNVAGLVDKSFAGGLSAILGGMVNVGGSFLRGHKTYYLVQQQEILALRRPSRSADEFAACRINGLRGTLTFSWQIHPILGQSYARPGTTQAFVQFSAPPIIAPATGPVAVACVRAGWHQTKDSGNQVVEPLEDEKAACFRVPFYSTKPQIDSVSVTDIGRGIVSVEIRGNNLPGLVVRSGQALITPIYSAVAGHAEVTFQEAAHDLVLANGASLVSRDGSETSIANPVFASPRLSVSQIQVRPYSARQSIVKLRFQRPASDFPAGSASCDWASDGPYVVTIGSNVFGLSDAPFRSIVCDPANPAIVDISLIAPSELLAASPNVRLGRLLWPSSYQAEVPMPESDLVVANVSLLSSIGGLSIALSGTGLDNARVLYPNIDPCQFAFTPYGSTFAVLMLKDPSQNCSGQAPQEWKQVVLCKENTVHTACNDNALPVSFDVPVPRTDPPKPNLAKHQPVSLHTRQIELQGQMLDQVISIQHGKVPLNFHLSLDERPSLIVDLTRQISDKPGVYTLEVDFVDKTTQYYSLTMQ